MTSKAKMLHQEAIVIDGMCPLARYGNSYARKMIFLICSNFLKVLTSTR